MLKEGSRAGRTASGPPATPGSPGRSAHVDAQVGVHGLLAAPGQAGEVAVAAKPNETGLSEAFLICTSMRTWLSPTLYVPTGSKVKERGAPGSAPAPPGSTATNTSTRALFLAYAALDILCLWTILSPADQNARMISWCGRR